MSIPTISQPPIPRSPSQPIRSRLVMVDAVRSEWIKTRSVRSTYWTLLAAMIAMVGLGALFASRYSQLTPSEQITINPTSYSLSGFFLAQLAVGVLAVLAMTSEYSTGSIRATLCSLPQRLTLLAAKSAVLIAITLPVATAASFAAFYTGQAILPTHAAAHLGNPGVLRSVLGAGLYLTALGVGSLALGALIRRAAGAIATVVALVFVLPGIVGALPTSWQNVTRYLPSSAGQAIIGHTRFASTSNHALLSPWTGFTVFIGYVAFALTTAAITLERRDS